jgi:membrane associated rhomboid family serine protease
MPGAIVISIGALVALHLLRSALGDEADVRLVLDLAFIPAQWTIAWDPGKAAEIVAGLAGLGADPERGAAAHLALAQYVLGRPEPAYWSIVTYALLHGSWTHILLNVVWLAAFGTPVARRCGAFRFFVLALAAALGGALAHFLAHPTSVLPMIGASAAISGMMAAAARFVFTGDHRVFQPGAGAAQDAGEPRLGLHALFRNRQAVFFLGVWFVLNIVFGLVASPLGMVEASIAWEAHLGGFIVGLLLFSLLDRVQPLRVRAT